MNGGQGNGKGTAKLELLKKLRREQEAEDERLRNNPTPLEAVAEQVRRAGTREELREARRVMEEWLREHPEDEYYFMEGGPGDGLHRIEAYLDRMSEEELKQHDRKVIEDRETYARLEAAGDEAGTLRRGRDGDRTAGPS